MLIVAGSGGVGKTTLAAALAIQAATWGRKTIVLTIDPAKRLAAALGLKQFAHTPEKIVCGNNQKLFAMMLDTKYTFDELIKKYAPSEDIANKIIGNRIYTYLSTMLAGTQNYMALEKLYELHESKEYDFIVLDTPPARHAMNFLEAPDRLSRFLDENTLKWFLKPYFIAGKLSIRLFSAGSHFFFKLIERLTGKELLYNLSEFFLNLQTLYGGFRERALKTKEILQSENTIFYLVTHPERAVFEQTLLFHKRLSEMRLPFGGVIVNRVAQSVPLSPSEKKEIKSLAKEKLSEQDQKLLEIFEHYRNLTIREKEYVSHLKKALPESAPLYEIPFFEQAVYDIKGLNLINHHLFYK